MLAHLLLEPLELPSQAQALPLELLPLLLEPQAGAGLQALRVRLELELRLRGPLPLQQALVPWLQQQGQPQQELLELEAGILCLRIGLHLVLFPS